MNLKAEYVTHGNNDLTVVNAAKVSFNKQSDVITPREVGLIKYLSSHGHWTPFAHSRFTFKATSPILSEIPENSNLRTGLIFASGTRKVRHSFFGWVQLIRCGMVQPMFVNDIMNKLSDAMPVSSQAYGLTTGHVNRSVNFVLDGMETDPMFIDHTLRETVPIFVARQRFKHTVDTDYNEVSRRYVKDEPEFYTPDAWRGAPIDGAKQGSSDEILDSDTFNDKLAEVHGKCLGVYNQMIADGVAPEQARMVLPQSMMTSYYVTANLDAWRRSYDLRIDAHAQKEIRDLAVLWGDVIEGLA